MSEATPTVIVSRRVRAGAEHDHDQWTNRMRSAVERFDGFLGCANEGSTRQWDTRGRDIDAACGQLRVLAGKRGLSV